MTALEVMRDEANKLGGLDFLSDSTLEYLMWEETGYPSFWWIPQDGNTPEECLRKQGREAMLKIHPRVQSRYERDPVI